MTTKNTVSEALGFLRGVTGEDSIRDIFGVAQVTDLLLDGFTPTDNQSAQASTVLKVRQKMEGLKLSSEHYSRWLNSTPGRFKDEETTPLELLREATEESRELLLELL